MRQLAIDRKFVYATAMFSWFENSIHVLVIKTSFLHGKWWQKDQMQYVSKHK